ncbi:MAG: zinc-ribbon domain-containing protein [Lachnospiraceae bacterium]|nr:zinc-ribbon domain-containing protein [Lachnospiraceae bacterium]
MYCTNCGKEIADGSVFCRHCGEQIGDDKTVYVVKDDADSELKKIPVSNYVKGSPVKNPSPMPLLIIAAVSVAVTVVLAIVLAVFIIKDRTGGAELVAAETVDPGPQVYRSVTGDPGQENAAEGQDTVPNSGANTLTVSVIGANETGSLGGAMVQVKGTGYEEYAETDGAGHAVFTGIAPGEYKIKCNADGYYENQIDVEVISADTEPVVPMIPVVTGDDAFVYLTWNGDHDLDLCAFNTELQEYVNIGHPADSVGSVFLYADHGADLPYEIIYIHDTEDEVTKSFFVTEAKNAREGLTSEMEADGVTVRIYDKTGLAYSSTADPEETAALWWPCYCYAGGFYDQQDYIYDLRGEQYEWLSFEEKDAYTGK